MRTPRFWLDQDLAVGREVSLPPGVAHHALKVLRLRNGAAITLFNGRGGEAAARLDTESCTAHVERFDAVERESPVAITLVQAWLVNIKLDWLAEKIVELGANRLLIVPSARSVAKLSGDRLRSRIDHLREVAISACAQSGRTRIPAINAAGSLEQGLTTAAAGASAVLLVPTSAQSLSAAVGEARRIAIAVGPEGGFDENEVALAVRIGYRPAHLGPRILRTETAGLAAIAHVQTRLGDWV
jgi:16S rRNA (uracil1498-N3)-methyltransferase